MSKPSKNIPMPISHRIRRWNEEIGSRSRRAPAFAVAASSFLPGKHGHAAHSQSIDSEAAILAKVVLLGGLEKFLAAPRRSRIGPKDALDQSISLRGQTISRTNLRDETDLQSLLRGDGMTEEDERKRKARQRVLTQVGHDRGGREAGTHLGKLQGGVLSDQNEVTQDREPEAEAKGVALHLRDADQGRSSQRTLDLDDASSFVADRLDVPARALPPRAEDLATCSNAQYACAGARCFFPKRGQHRVEHRAGDLVAVVGIVQCKGQDVAGQLDRQSGDRGIRQVRSSPLTRRQRYTRSLSPVNNCRREQEFCGEGA